MSQFYNLNTIMGYICRYPKVNKMQTILKLTFMLFLCASAQGQSFKGVIINSETQQPISQITIVSSDNTFFATSNDKGEIVLPESIINKKLFINDYEYIYSEKTFTSSQNFTWDLTPNSETLEEIVLYKNPKLILEEIINNSIKSFSSNIKLETYYRENYIENNQVGRFADGIIDFYVNSDQGNVQQVVKQSRAQSYTEINETNELLMSSPRQVLSLSMRFSEIRSLIKDNRHEFYIASKKVGDKTIHTCYISPKEKNRKRFQMKGYFIFDEEKKLILETSFAFDPEKKEYNNKTANVLIGKITFIDQQFKSKYVVADNLYYPTYAKRTIDLSSNSKIAKVKNERANNESYFYVLSIDKTATVPDVNKTSNYENLYSRGTIYKTEFWKDPEIINLNE